MSDIITGGKSIFEDKLFDGLLKEKDRSYGHDGHVYTFNREFRTYEFRISGNIHRGLPTKIVIYDRDRASSLPSYLGYLDVITGKLKSVPARAKYVDNVVDAWLRQRAGISLDQLGWDVSLNTKDGWGRIFRRTPAGNKKELAIVAASMPARRVDYYDSDGKKEIESATTKLKIPPGVYNYIREEFTNAGVFHDLLESYNVVRRRVSAWEDGPGYKHFRKEG